MRQREDVVVRPPLISTEPLYRGQVENVHQVLTFTTLNEASYLIGWHPIGNRTTPEVYLFDNYLGAFQFDGYTLTTEISLLGYVPVVTQTKQISKLVDAQFNVMRVSNGKMEIRQGTQGFHRSCVFGRAVAGAVARPSLRSLSSEEVLLQTIDDDRKLTSAFSNYAIDVDVSTDARFRLAPYVGPNPTGTSFSPIKRRVRVGIAQDGFPLLFTPYNVPPSTINLNGLNSLPLAVVEMPTILPGETFEAQLFVGSGGATVEAYTFFVFALYAAFTEAGTQLTKTVLLEKSYYAGGIVGQQKTYTVAPLDGYVCVGILVSAQTNVDPYTVNSLIVTVDILMPASEFSEAPVYCVLVGDTRDSQQVTVDVLYNIEGHLTNQTAAHAMSLAPPPVSVRGWKADAEGKPARTRKE